MRKRIITMFGFAAFAIFATMTTANAASLDVPANPNAFRSLSNVPTRSAPRALDRSVACDGLVAVRPTNHLDQPRSLDRNAPRPGSSGSFLHRIAAYVPTPL